MSIWDRDWYVDEICRRMGLGSSKRREGGYGVPPVSASSARRTGASRRVVQDGVKMPPQWTRPARNADRFQRTERPGMSKITVFALGVGVGVVFALLALAVSGGMR